MRAAYRFDQSTCDALAEAATRDRNELPTLADVLSYCLKLGVETYLSGQPDTADAVDPVLPSSVDPPTRD